MDSDEEKSIISFVEEKINGNKTRRGNNQDLIGHIERFRNGQRYNNNNYTGNVSPHRIDVQPNELYSGSSNSNGRRSGEGSGKVNKNEIQLNPQPYKRDKKTNLLIVDTFTDITGIKREVLGEMNDEFLSMLKDETYKSATEARGPPKNSEGKASRENISKRDKALYASGIYFLHKNFPPENKALSEAHRLATWWARKADTESGDQTLIFYE